MGGFELDSLIRDSSRAFVNTVVNLNNVPEKLDNFLIT